MTRKILRYAAVCGAALICLTSCGETASLVTPEVSAPASDRPFSDETEVVTTSTAAVVTKPAKDEEEVFRVNVAKPRGHEIAKKSVIKGFETVLQNPELPTGCEVTSLCQTLNFLGFKIDKVKLADKFMPMDMNGSTTLDHAYIGDPKLEDGFGCFPPVIVETADAYFESVDSPCYAEDMSGIELEKLFYQIEQGRPVIAWCTIDLVYFEPEHRWTTADGEEMWFSGMQHCVTIYGYDLKKKILYVADPLKGNVEYEIDRFKEMFDLIGKKAVVICGDSETEGHYNKNKDYQRSKFLTRKELEKKEKEEKKAAEEARKAEEEARKAEEEARKAEEEAARIAEEEAKKAEEEAARKAEEEAQKAAEEAARQAEEEAKRAEEEAARKAEEEEKKAEEAAKKAKEEAKKAEENARFAARSTAVNTAPVTTTTTKAKTTSVKTNTTKTTTKKKTTSATTTTTAKTSTKAKTTSVKVKKTTTTTAKGGKK